MIEKKDGRYYMTCDRCGKELEGQKTFQGAVELKRESGWRSVPMADGWKDRCVECAAEVAARKQREKERLRQMSGKGRRR